MFKKNYDENAKFMIMLVVLKIIMKNTYFMINKQNDFD